MKDKYQILQDQQTYWEQARPVMAKNNKDLLQLWAYLHQEVQEAGDEVVQACSELLETGAVAHKTTEVLADELADVFLFLQQMFSMIGVDMFEAVMTKRAYNITRYTAHGFSNGRTYQEARDDSRQWVQARNWKGQYYETN